MVQPILIVTLNFAYVKSFLIIHNAKTHQEEFIRIINESIPWDGLAPRSNQHYFDGRRVCPPIGIEKIPRKYLLQIWFNLSNKGVEDAIYDSYAMRKFMGN
jgi:IS5 family transposase